MPAPSAGDGGVAVPLAALGHLAPAPPGQVICMVFVGEPSLICQTLASAGLIAAQASAVLPEDCKPAPGHTQAPPVAVPLDGDALVAYEEDFFPALDAAVTDATEQQATLHAGTVPDELNEFPEVVDADVGADLGHSDSQWQATTDAGTAPDVQQPSLAKVKDALLSAPLHLQVSQRQATKLNGILPDELPAAPANVELDTNDKENELISDTNHGFTGGSGSSCEGDELLYDPIHYLGDGTESVDSMASSYAASAPDGGGEADIRGTQHIFHDASPHDSGHCPGPPYSPDMSKPVLIHCLRTRYRLQTGGFESGGLDPFESWDLSTLHCMARHNVT